MASGEAEPLQYTTTALRVSIHCEGCKKKVKKVLHSIEDVYKVTVDAAQHKVTVTGSVGADALVRRLHKAGKQAALWPSPAPVPVEAKKPEEEAALPTAAGESCAKDAETKEKPPEKGEGKEKKPAKDKKADKGEAPAKPSKDEKADKGEAPAKPSKDEKAVKGEAPAKPSKDKKADKGEASVKPSKDEASKDGDAIAEPNKEAQKGSPAPGKQDTAEEAGADEPGGGGKKGKKNKKSNKPMDGGDGEAPASAAAAPSEKPAPPQASPGPERPHGGAFPYYAAQPVLSYNVAHPSSSVSYSYYAPAAVVPMHPMPPPPQMVPYGFPPMVPAEFLYGPPGMRSSPPQEPYYYNGMLNEDNANSCSLM